MTLSVDRRAAALLTRVRTVLRIAAEVSGDAMSQFLMDDVGKLGLFEAVSVGAFDRVVELLDAGGFADDEESEEGEAERSRTPLLYIACTKKHARIVALLLKHGANPNAFYHRHSIIDSESVPCLIAAIPSVEIVEMLLSAGADPNKGHFQREDTGWEASPLERAGGNTELVALLRRYGARPAGDRAPGLRH